LGGAKEGWGFGGKKKQRTKKFRFSSPQIVYQLFKADSSQSIGKCVIIIS